MGRRKNNGEKYKEEKEGKIRFDVASDAKRSVAAVFLFALSLVVILGFFDKAGVVGISLNKTSSILIGWAKMILPIFLIIAGIVLLLRNETFFYVSKITGLIVTLIGLTGLLHWFFEEDKMLLAAKEGLGGGYVGYAVAFLSVKYLGKAGGFVVILALFMAGFIVAFNFSIFHFFRKIFKKREIAEGKDTDKLKKETVSGKTSDGKDENIKKIEFVEGPDQYVDEKLLEKASKIAKKISRKENEMSFSENFPKIEESDWKFPPLDLLEKSSGIAKGGDVEKNAEIIERTLKHFGIDVERGEIKTGPAVTQYSFRPAVGIKVSKILALTNDLALALAVHPIRIEAPIPGKSLIGIEVPNKISTMVRFRDILESADFINRKSNLMIVLGKDVSGNYIFGDLAKMPHLLIAGATNTGKSVCINSIITSLLYQNSPQNLKFIMVDPKRVELSLYNGIPHLLSDTIVENGKVVSALRWAVGEMERRYRLLQDTGSRDIVSYAEKLKKGEKRKHTDPETGETLEEEIEKLPYIVIVIDELADLMGSHGKEVEGAIVRIAQMARAVGIHLIVSTQRPEVRVITGLIKANITTRIALQVATQIDSRTILDMSGAEKLLGNGDMLYLSANSPKPKRVQGVFVSESEVKRVVKYMRNQKVDLLVSGEQEIGEDITSPAQGRTLEFADAGNRADEDLMYEAAKKEVIQAGKASSSLLQRRLRVGYARAARLMDILEERGIIGPSDGTNKPREVYAAKNTPGEAINYDSIIEDQTARDKWQM